MPWFYMTPDSNPPEALPACGHPPDPLVRRPGGLGRVGDNEMAQRVHSRKAVHSKVYSAVLGDAKILRKHVIP